MIQYATRSSSLYHPASTFLGNRLDVVINHPEGWHDVYRCTTYGERIIDKTAGLLYAYNYRRYHMGRRVMAEVKDAYYDGFNPYLPIDPARYNTIDEFYQSRNFNSYIVWLLRYRHHIVAKQNIRRTKGMLANGHLWPRLNLVLENRDIWRDDMSFMPYHFLPLPFYQKLYGDLISHLCKYNSSQWIEDSKTLYRKIYTWKISSRSISIISLPTTSLGFDDSTQMDSYFEAMDTYVGPITLKEDPERVYYITDRFVTDVDDSVFKDGALFPADAAIGLFGKVLFL